MKSIHSQRCRRALAGLALACWGAATLAGGQIVRPLYVGNIEAVCDQYGFPLPGSHLPAGAASRSRVEIRVAPYSLRLPPSPDGEAHPFNPLMTPDSVGGIGMNTSVSDAGLFWMVFPSRPASGTRIFARAYNAPTVEEASFYADSSVAEVNGTASTIVLTFDPAQELDPSIDPATGLSLSWLKFLGGDPNRDTDGDGVRDFDEWLAGTDYRNSQCLLAFDLIQRQTGPLPLGAGAEGLVTPVLLRWRAAPGRRYQIQFADMLAHGQEFTDVDAPMSAGTDQFELEKWVDLEEKRTGVFRLKLLAD